MTERFPVPRGNPGARPVSRNGTPGATGCPGRAELVAEQRGLTPDGVPG